MQIKPLGKITIPTAGTPVQVTTDATIFAHKVLISPVSGSKTVYIGAAGMNKATGANVVAELNQSAATGAGDRFELAAEDARNVIRVADLYLDASANGDSAYVTALIM
jgi:hypothetical protein